MPRQSVNKADLDLDVDNNPMLNVMHVLICCQKHTYMYEKTTKKKNLTRQTSQHLIENQNNKHKIH